MFSISRKYWNEKKKALNRFLIESDFSYPDHKFQGKGIVICGGGEKYFPNAWIAIHTMRDAGCRLPIELWYVGKEERISNERKKYLNNLGVICKDTTSYLTEDDQKLKLKGYGIKPFSIYHSSFEEILLLDADNITIRNPEPLFTDRKYLRIGAIFWPDVYPLQRNNPMFSFLQLRYQKGMEQESGQLIINKKKCWKSLCLTLFMNRNPEFYYQLVWGDKNTFIFSWMKTESSYFFIPTFVSVLGIYPFSLENVSFIQHDVQGERLFLHYISKWKHGDTFRNRWRHIKKQVNHPRFSDLEYEKTNEFDLLERKCLSYLEKLSDSNFLRSTDS